MTADSLNDAPAPPADAQRARAATDPLAVLQRGDTLWLDGVASGAWDAATASRLWELARRARERGIAVRTDRLPPGLSDVLALAADSAPAGSRNDHPLEPTRAGPLEQAAVTVTFVGQVLLAMARRRTDGTALRAELVHQLDTAGPRSLAIVTLCCALIGLMLAYMAGAQLGRIGAQSYLADVVTVGMVREIGGLMTGIVLAGRVGSAYAAQLATMQAGEEIDALRVLGVDPVSHLVLPRLAALVAMGPLLIAFGAVAGVCAGWPAATLAYGVGTAEYFQQCLAALNATHLLIGGFKGLLYVALVALAGCREGLHAGRSAQAVGEATTRAVVKALVWIVTAACGTTVVFTTLGY